MAELLKTLLMLTLGGSVLTLLLLALRYIFLRRMPATVYYYLWIFVLLRFVLPVPSVVPWDLLESQMSQGSVISPIVQSEEHRRVYTQPGSYPVPKSQYTPESYDISLPTVEAETEKPSRSAGVYMASLPWGRIVISIWAGGTLISLARYVGGYLRFSCLVRRYARRPKLDDTRCYCRVCRRKKPELIRSEYVTTPMLMGVSRPVLVLPDADYTQTQLENIFLHELMHYSRRDIVYKWLAMPVFAFQWFNPLAYLARREINRACELSCDELLIAKMERAQKQSYGETLISLASAGRLPAGIVATTFTMEKRDLRERLVKIMKFRERKVSAVLALLLSALLLAGCGAVLGPEKAQAEEVNTDVSPTAEPVAPVESDDGSIAVNSVDGLLAAIAPNTTIRLEPGVYDLTTAADYGQTSEGKYYSWEETYDGFELVIPGVENLSIIGSHDMTTIATQPRYANVLKLKSCSNVRLEAMIIGHTEEQGFCSGGVLYLDSCNDVYIDSCKLYGCGTIGIFTQNCKRVYAEKCSIYECSHNAVYSIASHDVRVTDCNIHDCGEGMVQSVFTVDSSMGFAVVNSRIYANTALHLIDSRYSQQVSLMGCTIEENVFTEPMFWCEGYSVIVEDCVFELNHHSYLYDRGDGQPKLPPVNSQGMELTEKDLISMKQAPVTYEGPEKADAVKLDEAVDEGGIRHVTVSTVDEFLAAIGDNTVITLAAPLFDLSTASDYGAFGSDYYYWFNMYDGPGLVISGVKNLSIIGEGTVISAIPRYANVLGFVNCEGITLEGFTAGHTEEPGECAGGVLDFQNCSGIDILKCRLYGCGILGIAAQGCEDIYVEETEIYDCSQGAVALYNVRTAVFENCDIHDCRSPEISLSDCSGVLYNGESLKYGAFKIENRKPVEFQW